MLNIPKHNVNNIMRVIESIKNDPEFNMASWPHCICGHCHTVMGDTKYDGVYDAYAFLGVDPHEEHNIFANGDYRDKEWALQLLNDLTLV